MLDPVRPVRTTFRTNHLIINVKAETSDVKGAGQQDQSSWSEPLKRLGVLYEIGNESVLRMCIGSEVRCSVWPPIAYHSQLHVLFMPKRSLISSNYLGCGQLRVVMRVHAWASASAQFLQCRTCLYCTMKPHKHTMLAIPNKVVSQCRTNLSCTVKPYYTLKGFSMQYKGIGHWTPWACLSSV